MRGWRALLTTANTILTNWITWYKLCALTIVCFLTTAIVILTNSQGSIGDIDVTSRVQLLLSFVLAGYVTYYVNYYNSVRHQYLGTLWGALENLVLYGHQLFKGNTEQEKIIINTIRRYTLSIFRLVFHSCQGKTDLDFFYERDLLTKEEGEILLQYSLGTRPLIIVGWLSSLFEKANQLGYNNFILNTQILSTISSLRGGIGGLLGVIGTPPPFMYTHLMYWIVQIFLLILAITTGINLAVFWDRKQNGDENYSYDDSSKHWPNNSRIYYVNYFFQQTAGNMIFAIFVEGLLYFCGEIENPLAGRDGSFSEDVYETFLNNNCIALINGRESFEKISNTSIHLLNGNHNNNNINTIDHNFLELSHLMNNNGNNNGNNNILNLINQRKIKQIKDMNCEELSERVLSLGNVYLKYSEKIKELGITGEVFLQLTENDLRNDLNIQEKYHFKAILLLQKNDVTTTRIEQLNEENKNSIE